MVGDGGLGEAERPGEVADADLAGLVCGDDGDQPPMPSARPGSRNGQRHAHVRDVPAQLSLLIGSPAVGQAPGIASITATG